MFIFLSLVQATFSVPDNSYQNLFFKTTGDSQVVDGNYFILAGQSKASRSGGMITKDLIQLKSFEMKIDLNFDKTSSTSFWFSRNTQDLGHLYGLSSTFEGFGLFCDVKESSCFLHESKQDLKIFSHSKPESCRIDFSQLKSLHLHIQSQSFEVWVEQSKLFRCAEVREKQVKITPFNQSYFGIYSVSSAGSIKVSQISLLPNENELLRTLNDSELSHHVTQKLLYAEAKLIALESHLKSLASQDYVQIEKTIHDLALRLENLLNLTPKMHKTLKDLHLEDKFTKYANTEILKITQQLTSINEHFLKLYNYVDSKQILSEADEIIEARYYKMTSHGSLLKKDLKQAETNFKTFEKHFESDQRMLLVHILLLVFFLAVLVLCCKICCIEESS